MSRIGKKPVPLPSGVEVAVQGRRVTVKGPKGSLEQEITGGIEVAVEQNPRQVVVRRTTELRADRAKHGLYRSLLAGMVVGVTQGFERALEIHGVGYRAIKDGDVLALQVGFALPRRLPIPPGISIEVPDQQRIIVRGISKQLVGNFAATIRAVRKTDPYKNKGIRYAGEEVRKLAGKTFASGGAT